MRNGPPWSAARSFVLVSQSDHAPEVPCVVMVPEPTVFLAVAAHATGSRDTASTSRNFLIMYLLCRVRLCFW